MQTKWTEEIRCGWYNMYNTPASLLIWFVADRTTSWGKNCTIWFHNNFLKL